VKRMRGKETTVKRTGKAIRTGDLEHCTRNRLCY
jgi:hypothetical protein